MFSARRQQWAFIGVLLLAIALVLGPFILAGDGSIPSHRGGDTARYTAMARAFFVEEVMSGNFPLWNPHTFSGTPFVGIFQSAAFHPFGLLYFVLPLSSAISLEFALNLLLLGIFTYWWLRDGGRSALAAAFAAFSVVFGASCFLRVAAGQFAVLETFVWTPLLWMSVERILRRPSLRWVLVGSGATGLMMIAGHPPTVFMAGAATAAYLVAVAWGTSIPTPRGRVLASFIAIPVIGVLLSAVQLWPGLEVATESVRHAGGSFEFSTTFSMPLESLLTLFVPELYAVPDGSRLVYWGRWFYWDASAFIGLVALFFAIHGVIATQGWRRDSSLVLFVLFALLSFGRYTPLYELLFNIVPGFSFFRAPSKFMFYATLFAAPLVAAGVDQVIKSRSRVHVTASIAGVVALLLLAVTGWASWSQTDPMGPHSLATWLSWLADEPLPKARAVDRWQASLLFSLGMASALAAASAVLFFIHARRGRGVWPIVLLVVIGSAELVHFGHRNRFGADAPNPPDRVEHIKAAYEQAGEGRILEFGGSNLAMPLHGYAIWGYDPVKLDRYVRFIARSQGRKDIDLADEDTLSPHRYTPSLAMLRTRIYMSMSGPPNFAEGALPRFLLLTDYEVVEDAASARDAVFTAGFDPRWTVVLEEAPDPQPAPGRPQGQIELVGETTDSLDFEAELERPAILLVTDAYAEGWRTRPLSGSSQASYQLLAADSVLRAVPLDAGYHRFRVEYAPLGFRAGAWISGIAWLGFVFVSWRVARPRTRGRPSRPGHEPPASMA